jgi:hypothetical protein
VLDKELPKMTPRDVKRLQLTDADRILQDLSSRQHTGPHQRLGEALERASQALGFCPQAAETALRWLQLDSNAVIGRLRRTQLIQLSRSIHRFWRQALAAQSVQPQSV